MFSHYNDLGLALIPLKYGKKFPGFNGWDKFSSTLPTSKEIELWERSAGMSKMNFGLVLGEASGLMALDLDTDDKELLAMAPLSPVVKRGAEGETRFFRPCPGIRSAHPEGLDILWTGCQTVMPPSIHPDTGKPYVWLTPDTLENFDVKDLPVVDLSFVPEYVRIFEERYPELCQKTKGNPTGNGGRNNRLKDIAVAMLHRGEDNDTIAAELVKEDATHDVPLFTDQSEQYGAKTEAQIEQAALRMVRSIRKSTKTKVSFGQDISISTSSATKLKFKEYPKPGGILEKLANISNDMSPRELTSINLGGAIATMSTVIANRFRFGTIWPNVYILNIAETGAGKSWPQLCIKKVLIETLRTTMVRPAGSHSVAGLLRGLPKQRERLDVIDEVSSLFRRMGKDGSSFQQDLMEALCKLWSESNSYMGADVYATKDDDSCWNPCVSILGSTTPSGFTESVDRSSFSKGLIPRFLTFCEDGYGKPKNPTDVSKAVLSVADDIKLILKIPKPVDDSERDILGGPKYSPINIGPTEKADIEFARAIRLDYALKTEKADSELMKQLYNRGYEHICRLSMIHSVSSGVPTVSRESLEWGVETFEACMHNAASFFEEAATDGTKFDSLFNRIKSAVKRSGFMSSRDLQRKFTISKRELSELTTSLVSAEFLTPSFRMNGSQKIPGFDYLRDS